MATLTMATHLHALLVLHEHKIGGFGGGWLEHPKRWLGAQWTGIFLGVPGCPEPPGAPPSGGAGAELGRCQGAELGPL
eukprot:scaffold29725_cov54-Phaeocystis_antarctica.AAC.1